MNIPLSTAVRLIVEIDGDTGDRAENAAAEKLLDALLDGRLQCFGDAVGARNTGEPVPFGLFRRAGAFNPTDAELFDENLERRPLLEWGDGEAGDVIREGNSRLWTNLWVREADLRAAFEGASRRPEPIPAGDIVLDDPYWTLDQTVAWARSRNEDVVRFALSHSGVALEVKINVEAKKAMKDGHDIEWQFWKAIGREKPQDAPLSSFGEDPITVTWQNDKGEQFCDTLTHVAGDPFPINQHIQRLLQSGKLVAFGRLDGEPVNRRIEGVEWTGLQINEDRDGRRVVTRGGGGGEVIRDVRIDRDLVVAAFPAVIAADGVTRPAELKQEQVTVVSKRGRKPAIDWGMVDKEVFRLMDHHNNFSADDPDWNCQACLERAIADYLSRLYGDAAPATSTIRGRITGALSRWQARNRQ